jgi:hypothetical protein
VAPLADGTLNVAMNIAALANTGAVMNVKVRIRLCFTLGNGIFSELKQSGCGECI